MRGAPEEIGRWLDDHGTKLTHADSKLARQAIVRVQRGSELQEL